MVVVLVEERWDMHSVEQADRVTAKELRTLHRVVFSLDGLAHPACHFL